MTNEIKPVTRKFHPLPSPPPDARSERTGDWVSYPDYGIIRLEPLPGSALAMIRAAIQGEKKE